MKTILACVIALTFCGASLLAADRPLPTADELVARHVEARGGAMRLAALRSIIYRGDYKEGEHAMPGAAMALMRPYYKLVGDPEHPDPDFAEGYDGSAWEYYGDPGIVLRTVGPAAAASRHGLWIDGPLPEYRIKGSTITVEGIEPIGGRDAYRLRVRMRDGFEEEEFLDVENSLWVASRKVAPIHAFGERIRTENRFSDYRPAGGILFSFRSEEVEIATGKVLNSMTWRSIIVNPPLDAAAFSPPPLRRSPLQTLLDQLFQARDDVEAVLWTYHDFRRAHPEVETDEGMEVIGYQMLKMGRGDSAVALLAQNAAAYPKSTGAAFGLGRAYAGTGEVSRARAEYERARSLDPKNTRAADALAKLKD